MIRFSLRFALSLLLVICILSASLAQEPAQKPRKKARQKPAKKAAQKPAKKAAKTEVQETPKKEAKKAAKTEVQETPKKEVQETPKKEAKKAEVAEPTLPESWVNTLQWRSIGPANMSGRITALAVYEKDPNIWWAASASGGLLKTINNGVTFEHQFDRQATVSIGDVQVAQSDPNIVWVGTGEANPRNSVSWGDGVYKSIDGGKTWKNMGLKKTFQIGRMAIHPKDPNIVYVGALGRLWGPNEDRGLYKTTDGGETWKKILFVDDKTGVIDLQMNPKNPDNLIVAMYERQRDGFDSNDPAKKFGPGSGVYVTRNGGKSFQKATKGLPTCNLGRIGISIYRKDPKQIYLVLESDKIGQVPENAGYAGFVAEDADVGARLTEIVKDTPAEKAGLKKGDIVISLNGKTLHSYAELSKALDQRVVGDKMKLGLSRDRKSVEVELVLGKRPPRQQRQQRRGAPPSTMSAQDRARSGSKYAASLGGQRQNQIQGPTGHEYGGIYHSKDGGKTWKRINSLNPRPMYYSQIRVDPTDNKKIWVLGTSLYLSKDGGENFSSDNTARGIHVDHHSMWIDPRDSRHVILGNDGGIHVTYDLGLNWDHHNHIAIGQFYHVAVGPRRDYFVYGGLQDNGSWGGPSRGPDGSGTLNTDWIRIGGGDGFICLVDPEDPDQIYSESQGGATGRINLRTGERGSMRPRPPRNTRYRFNWKTPFILSPHNSRIYYSAGNYVFRSPNKGNNLVAISPEITLTNKGSASALSEAPAELGVLYAGTTDGALWGTRDGGHEWTNLYGKTDEKSEEPSDKEPADKEPAKQESSEKSASDESTSSGQADSPRRRGPPGRGPGGFLAMLKQQDKNGDGKIQKDEVSDRMSRMFGQLDTNDDDVVDEAEMKAMAERVGRRGGAGPPAARRGDPPAKAKPEKTADKADEPEVKKESQKQAAEPKKTAKPAAKKPAPSKKEAAKPAAKEAAQPVIKEDIVSGTWEGQFEREGIPREQSAFTVVMRMDPQGKLTGSFKSRMSEGPGEGQFDPKNKQVNFSVETERSTIEVIGTVSGTAMSGEVDVNSGMFTVDFKAKRTGDAPAVKAEAKTPAEKPGQQLTDLLPGPRWISSIEASRFKRGRVYVTADGHRSNDDKPYVLASEDYGKTWRSILANIPESVGSARVIREDIKNENVLYLGTEFSIWVTVDRGQTWTKLNSNLPTVAVHEVAIHPTAGEIVAGTHGRSLWILDVAALRQVTAETIEADAHLYAPQSAVKWRSKPSRGSSGTRRFVGQNRPSGAPIYYSLGKKAGAVSLKITDVEGKLVREFEADADAGLHRVTWDMRRVVPQTRSTSQRSPGSRGGPPSSSRFRRGSSVASGKYLVTLTVDDKVLTHVLTIEDDPNTPAGG